MASKSNKPITILSQGLSGTEKNRHADNEPRSQTSFRLAEAETPPQQESPYLGQPMKSNGKPLFLESPLDRRQAAFRCLKEAKKEADILQAYRGTPIEAWLRYHNGGQGPRFYDFPQLLIVTCMDFRIQLRVPEKLAYVLRLAGANFRYREFDLACALSFAQIRHVCLVGHTLCAMESLETSRERFTMGLEKIGGWDQATAAEQFDLHVSSYSVSDGVDFILYQTAWLETRFRGLMVAPLLYDTDNHFLYQIVRRE